MPFNPPYARYKAGDILYGLAQPRGELAQAMGIKQGDIYTIDQYDTFADARPRGAPLSGLKYDPEFNAAVARATDGQSKYADLNSGAQWAAHPDAMGAVARRKCKTGIDYICRNASGTIHFCLDGLDIFAVAAKSYDGPGARDNPKGKAHDQAWFEKSRSITGAEIRWVYRHRNDVAIRSRIQFWNRESGQWVPCPPPWDDTRVPFVQAAFRCYQPSAEPMDVD